MTGPTLDRRALLAGSLLLPSLQGQSISNDRPLRFAIAGLVHGHVTGFLRALQGRERIAEVVGLSDPNAELHAKIARQFSLPEKLFHRGLEAMLDAVKPEAVATFTSTRDHLPVIEACAARRIPVMVEKPLAVDTAQGRAIAQAARRGSIPVLVNYETTWYRSHAALWRLLKEQKAAGELRKMVAMDGHQGPKEINVQPEFFAWLTDPVQNGAGALFDFGCYGANLMTWLLDNQRPLAVTARTQQIKPHIYGRVDDEATIVLDYPKAQGIVQASWNWPFSRKDFEVYAERGYAHAMGGNTLRVRLPGQTQEETQTPAELPADERDSVAYLAAVVRGRLKLGGLSSLENNLIVTEILDAARRSAKTGRAVTLG